jgi:capsular polysaccharide biosynthesis protein
MTSFQTWSDNEGSAFETLLVQEPLAGRFEYIDVQGKRYTSQHTVPRIEIGVIRVAGLLIRDTELLIGPKGSIAKPAAWHYRDVYGYPRPSAIRLNHGLKGCRLKLAQERVHVQEPVIVLGNMDGPYYRNYYHWMLLILTRVALLLDRGALDHRRLLIPHELTDWMTTSLSLIGVPDERTLRHYASQEVLIDDAWIISPLEFAAESLVRSLQRRLWDAAAVASTSTASRRGVWLSRRQQPWRSLVNVKAAESVALALGFDVIIPESLPLLEQVRVCATARVIAGPGGANLTNLMFARPTTAVVGVVSESNNYPGFIDLCAAMGLDQCWVFGRADPRKASGGPLHEGFEVNVMNLERALERAISKMPEA